MSEQVLTILEPWQMVPLDIVEDALAYLDGMLQPHHPLRQHNLFPLLKREDAPVWILTKEDDDGTIWLLDLTRKRRLGGRRIAHHQLLTDEAELAALIQHDHQQWLAQSDDEDDGDGHLPD